MVGRSYDLHVHTDASPCSGAPPAAVVRGAVEAGLAGIAVTDHDTTANVAAVEAAAPDELTVIPGVEVTTSDGHLLALGVEETPPCREVTAVADWVHDREGVTVLAHPFDSFRDHYDDPAAVASSVDAVETVNSRCLARRFNGRARSFARRHELAVTGGSDAHFPVELGRATTRCEGAPVAAIRNGETETAGRGRYVSGHVATKLHEFAERVRPRP